MREINPNVIRAWQNETDARSLRCFTSDNINRQFDMLKYVLVDLLGWATVNPMWNADSPASVPELIIDEVDSLRVRRVGANLCGRQADSRPAIPRPPASANTTLCEQNAEHGFTATAAVWDQDC